MKKVGIVLLKVVCFCGLLFGCLHFINLTLTPKFTRQNRYNWPTTSAFNQFYKMDKNTVDVLFLGASVAENAYNPQILYNDFGITSYNLSSEQQTPMLSYFWIKEALRFQKPKAVVVDTMFLFEMYSYKVHPVNTPAAFCRKCLDPMKWSSVKKEAVNELCKNDDTQIRLGYYFPNYNYNTRWSELGEADYDIQHYEYDKLKGFAPLQHFDPGTYGPYVHGDDYESLLETHTLMQEYLDKTVELCKKENIHLVLTTIPRSWGWPMFDAKHNTLTKYAKDNDITYIDFEEESVFDQLGCVFPQDSPFDHMNIWGANKVTSYLGRMFVNDFSIEPRTSKQYENTKEYYKHICDNCYLPHINDFEEYLDALANNDKYSIFITACNDAAGGLTPVIREKLNNLGLKIDLAGKDKWSYCAAIIPGQEVIEKISPNSVASYEGSFRDGKSFYELASAGEEFGDYASTYIDGSERGRSGRGLNFVVFDNELIRVLDSVTFDTSTDLSPRR